MTKSLTKLWLSEMKRVLHLPATPAATPAATRSPVSGGAKAAAPVAAPLVDPVVTPVVAHASPASPELAEPHESRVGPRGAAWASGEWIRGDHPLPPAPGRFVQHLKYGLYVPPSAVKKSGLPLVVMLHGCKQDIDQFSTGTQMNLLADRHCFAVLYPEQSEQAHAHRCWHWYEDTMRGGMGEAQAVAELVDTLIDEHGFDASRVYAAGLSAGAGLVSLLALHFPQRFAAVALHSGPAFGEARSGMAAMDVMRRGLHHNPAAVVDALVEPGEHPGMPAMIVQGDDDRVVAPANGEQLAIQFLRLNGLADGEGVPSGADCVEWHDGAMTAVDYRRDGEPVVRLCRIEGLAHAWSGGDDSVPFHAAGGPDSSALIWSFFASRERVAVAS